VKTCSVPHFKKEQQNGRENNWSACLSYHNFRLLVFVTFAPRSKKDICKINYINEEERRQITGLFDRAENLQRSMQLVQMPRNEIVETCDKIRDIEKQMIAIIDAATIRELRMDEHFKNPPRLMRSPPMTEHEARRRKLENGNQ
jgi:hypothetical protein